MPNARTEVRRSPGLRTLLAPRCRSDSAGSEDSPTAGGAGAEEEWEEERLGRAARAARAARSQEAARAPELCGGDASASPAAHLRRLGLYFLPEWVASYRWELLPFDVVAGVTITTIVVPQCVAYALLANLPAEYGLYSSVIPVLVYSFLGTSHFVHVGTFALTSLLVGSSVTNILNRAIENNPSGDLLRAENGTFVYHWDAPLANLRRNGDPDPSVDAALMLTVIVGCTQLLAGICFLGGVVGRLIPDEVVSGFTSSSAVHIVTSQIRSLTGQPIPSYTGPLSLFKTWWHALTTLHRTHVPTLAFGCLSAALLIGIQLIDRLRKRQQADAKKIDQRQTDVEDGNASFQNGPQVIIDHTFAQEGLRKSPQLVRKTFSPSQRLDSQDGMPRLIRSPASAYGRVDGLPDLADAATASGEWAPEKQYPVPDILIVVVAATTASWTLSASDLGIRVLGRIPTGLRGLNNPVSNDIVAATGGDFFTTFGMFLPSALGLSVVSYVMSIAIVKAFSAPSPDVPMSPSGPAFSGNCQGNLPFSKLAASDSPTSTPPSPTTPTAQWDFAGNAATAAAPRVSSQDFLPYNRELLALGAASTVGSAFGAYVCTGSLTRTAVLRRAGGRTPLASVVSALGVAACCYLLAPLMAAIPLCSLAAVIAVTCGKLVGQARDFAALWRETRRGDGDPEGKCGGRRADAAMWAAVFAVVIIGGVDVGACVMMVSAALRNLATWMRNFRNRRRDM